MTRLAYVHAGREPGGLAAKDLDLLARRFDVLPVPWRGPRDLRAIRAALRGRDAVVSWSAGHHAAAAGLAAQLARRPSIVDLAGEEVLPRSEVEGGAPQRLRDRWAAQYALRTARLVLASSHFSAGMVMRALPPRSGAEVRVVYWGADTERFRPGGPKEALVATVAVLSASSARRKRLPVFAQAARLVPEARFIITGPHLDGTAAEIRAAAPPNLELLGPLAQDQLVALLQRARVYVQASRHEAFGVANAEAMACGCVPVVTRASALPEVVGGAGVYVEEPPTPVVLAVAVREALASDLGSRARARIVEHFDLRRREEGLRAAVEDAVGGRCRPGRSDRGSPRPP